MLQQLIHHMREVTVTLLILQILPADTRVCGWVSGDSILIMLQVFFH